jgi:hypothetical protein
VPSAIAEKWIAGEAGRGLVAVLRADLATRLALSGAFCPAPTGNSAQFGQARLVHRGPREPSLSDFAPPLSLNVARITEAQKGRGGAVRLNSAILP